MKTQSIDTQRIKLAGGLTAVCLAFAALAGQGGQAAAASGETQVQADVIAGQVAARDDAVATRSQRGYLAQAQAVVAQAVQSAPKVTGPEAGKHAPAGTAKAPAPVAAAPRPVDPTPVAGLNQTQMNNAKKIVDTAKSMGLGKRAQVIAVATAMQESTLYNLASTRLPESAAYGTEGFGSDHDSVGLFQQRSSTGWGPVKDLMRPEFATKQFLEALVQVPGWDQLPLTVAAQRVQVSAYPDHYAKHEARATAIVEALQ